LKLKKHIQKLADHIEEKDQEIQDLTTTTVAAAQRIQELAAQVESKDQDSQKLASEIQNKDAEIAKLTNEVGDRDQKIQDLTTTTGAAAQRIQELTTQVESKDQDSQKLASEIQNKDAEIAKLAKEAADKDEGIVTLTTEVQSKKAAIDRLISEDKGKNQEIQDLTAKAQRDAQEILKLKEDIQKLANQIEEKDQEIQNITLQKQAKENHIDDFIEKEQALKKKVIELSSQTKRAAEENDLLNEELSCLKNKLKEILSLRQLDQDKFRQLLDEAKNTNKRLNYMVDTQQNRAKLLDPQEAGRKAELLLDGRNLDYITQEESLREILRLELHAAENKAKYCAEKFEAVKKSPVVKRVLLEVCMERSKYASEYLTTLNNIKGAKKLADIEDIIAALDANNGSDEFKGIWGHEKVSLKNAHNSPWILSSPQYLDSARTQIDPDMHSNNFLKIWSDTIAKGTRFVDITTLDKPRETFMKALVKSIKTLYKNATEENPIVVRILFGAHKPTLLKTMENDVHAIYREITFSIVEDLTESKKMRIFVGAFDASSKTKLKLASWNHSKIVAVDGNLMLTGGHNLYEDYVRSNNPVHDLSALVPGKIACIGHNFANELWDYVKRYAKKGKWAQVAGGLVEDIPMFHDSDIRENTNIDNSSDLAEPIIAVGRLATIYEGTQTEPSDTAQLSIIENAQKAIFISQQAITKVYDINQTIFNSNILYSLMRAIIKRDVDVYILKSSNDNRFNDGGNYKSNIERLAMPETFLTWVKSEDRGPLNDSEIMEKIFAHLRVLDTANKNHEVPNHAKVLIADASVAYIGSHNHYDDSHAEFGIVLGSKASHELLTDYFMPFWIASTQGEQTVSSLHDYSEGDYVLIRREQNNEDEAPENIMPSPLSDSMIDFVVVDHPQVKNNPSQEWTLAKVKRVDMDELEVILDFLHKEGSRTEIIRSAADIQKAPGFSSISAPF
jgi:phosphatidylserine/phosphatidylglycerophosphate/cardiolipin synthase-like enzyme